MEFHTPVPTLSDGPLGEPDAHYVVSEGASGASGASVLTAPVSVAGPVNVRRLPTRNSGYRTQLCPNRANASTNGGGAIRLLTHDPRRRRVLLCIQSQAVTTPGTLTVVQGSFAAGASGSVSLPAGYSMLGFTVTSAAPAAVVSGTVVVNGLVGSNQSYVFTQSPSAGGLLSETFPTALGPFLPASTPGVTVPVITGGAAGQITVYGTSQAVTVPASGLRVGNSQAEANGDIGALFPGGGTLLEVHSVDAMWASGDTGDVLVTILSEEWTR